MEHSIDKQKPLPSGLTTDLRHNIGIAARITVCFYENAIVRHTKRSKVKDIVRFGTSAQRIFQRKERCPCQKQVRKLLHGQAIHAATYSLFQASTILKKRDMVRKQTKTAPLWIYSVRQKWWTVEVEEQETSPTGTPVNAEFELSRVYILSLLLPQYANQLERKGQ